MGIRSKMGRTLAGLTLVTLATVPTMALAAEHERPSSAKICLNCHKPEPNNLRGHWESVAMKSSSLQLKIDNTAQVLKFDKSNLKVLNVPQNGDLEKMLKGIKKGHEVRIEYVERDGGKVATAVSSKPPVKLADNEKLSLAEMEKLVSQGPEKGKYYLFDSRPAPRFKEGAIPTAVSLPYPEFDKQAGKLPADKNSLIIFYCSGMTCNMSPGSQKKAKALGYTNVKVFVEGMPTWLSRNYGVLPAAAYHDAYKDIAHVLLDARPAEAQKNGWLKGAVVIPPTEEALVKSLPKKELKAPLVIYDENGAGNATKIATAIIRGGQTNVFVLSDGFAGAQKAQLAMGAGVPSTVISYVPKPKPGEVLMADFVRIMAATPDDTVLVDVRGADELTEGTIKGALNIPAEEVDQHLNKLPAGKRVITFCNTGTRAEMAYHSLSNKGVANVQFLNAKVFFDDGKPEVSK
ncbi:MAG TPA: rhodanese-like domain-containing protein [Geobacteraceae bacterium]